MLQHQLSKSPKRKRRELLITAVLLLSIFFLVKKDHASIFSFVMLGLGSLAAVGGVFFKQIGQNVYFVLALISTTIGRVVGFVTLSLIYCLAIVPTGLVLKCIGVDKLRKNFSKCKLLPTMFDDAPLSELASFQRQS